MTYIISVINSLNIFNFANERSFSSSFQDFLIFFAYQIFFTMYITHFIITILFVVHGVSEVYKSKLSSIGNVYR